MRSERELMDECREYFGDDIEILILQLELKVKQNLENTNLLTAKYYLEDIKVLKGIQTRREIR